MARERDSLKDSAEDSPSDSAWIFLRGQCSFARFPYFSFPTNKHTRFSVSFDFSELAAKILQPLIYGWCFWALGVERGFRRGKCPGKLDSGSTAISGSSNGTDGTTLDHLFPSVFHLLTSTIRTPNIKKQITPTLSRLG